MHITNELFNLSKCIISMIHSPYFFCQRCHEDFLKNISSQHQSRDFVGSNNRKKWSTSPYLGEFRVHVNRNPWPVENLLVSCALLTFDFPNIIHYKSQTLYCQMHTPQPVSCFSYHSIFYRTSIQHITACYKSTGPLCQRFCWNIGIWRGVTLICKNSARVCTGLSFRKFTSLFLESCIA